MATTYRLGTGFDRGGMTVVNRYFQAVTVSGSYPQIGSGSGRRSGNCLMLNAGSKIVATHTADDEIVLAIALKVSAAPSSGFLIRFLRAGSHQVAMNVTNDGRLTFGVGSAVTGLGITTGSLSFGFWSQIQIAIKCHASTGELKVYWNGSATPDATLDLTGIDTHGAGADALIDGFEIQPSGAGASIVVSLDDMLLGTGDITDLPGDVALVADAPVSDGALEDLTCTTGSDMAAMVNESTPDVDDSSTISGTTGQASFNYADLSFTPDSVPVVFTKVMAKKDDSGTRTLNDVVKLGGTEYQGTAYDLTTDYRVVDLPRQDIGGSPLTKTNIDANEWGIEFA